MLSRMRKRAPSSFRLSAGPQVCPSPRGGKLRSPGAPRRGGGSGLADLLSRIKKRAPSSFRLSASPQVCPSPRGGQLRSPGASPPMLRRLLGSFPKIFGARARSFDMPERGPAERGRREAEALQGQRKQVLCFAGLCRGQRKQVSTNQRTPRLDQPAHAKARPTSARLRSATSAAESAAAPPAKLWRAGKGKGGGLARGGRAGKGEGGLARGRGCAVRTKDSSVYGLQHLPILPRPGIEPGTFRSSV